MSIDPRTPVLVGAAQMTQHVDELTDAVEPLAMMEQVVRGAAVDAGSTSLLADLDVIGVVQGAWRYTDPARLIAERIGADNARTSLSYQGGNTPQSFLNSFASRIAKGELDVAVVCGAEAIWSRRRQRRAGLESNVTRQPPATPDERFGQEVAMSTDFEQSRGMVMPVNFYPVFESAIRHRLGESIADHRTRIANLWEGFNQVSVTNPFGWIQTPMTADEIREPEDGNRMVGFPYTKAMNSNWDLDQAAALIICSAEAARAAGVPSDRWVFPHAGADAADTASVSQRRDLHSSPAITECGRSVFAATNTGPDDLAHLDLYSCFPSAVQVGAEALGISQDRQLTQTGGLTFAGGPLNNYVTHSIAAMVNTLRQDPGSLGLVSANGGFLTKHSLGLYSTDPSPSGWRFSDVQSAVDEVPRTEVDESYVGPVTVEAYTVMHDSDGPEVGLFALRTADQARTWGSIRASAVLGDVMEREAIGQSGQLDSDGVLALA